MDGTEDAGDDNWANTFRGMGWDGTNYPGITVNTNITVTIEALL
jgi:hypothetical protein